MKTFRILMTVLLIAIVALAACGTEEEPTAAPETAEETVVEEPTTAPEPDPTEAPEETVEEPPAGLTCDEPIKVGLITDLTGGLAIYGEMIQRSFMLGMEYVTGDPGQDGVYQYDNCPVEVIVRDDQSNPETTATVARELIEVEQVDLLVGTVSSGATATLQEIARENDIVLIVGPAAANDITGVNFNENTFRVSRNNYQDAVNQCEFMTEDYSTFVQIAPDYAFGWGGAQGFRDACTFFGGEFVADDIFAPADTTDFTPYMEQILDSGAEAWVVTWAGGGFIPMMDSAAEMGVTDEMALGTAFINNALIPVFFGNAVGTTAGILYHYSAPDNPINDWLIEQTVDRYGLPPDLFDADGMNAAIALLSALQASGGDTSSAALIGALEGLEFDGPKGSVYLRPEDHVAIQDMYILTLTNIDDPDFMFYDYVKTTRPPVPCLLPEELQDRCGDLPIGALGEFVEAPAEEPAAGLTCDEPIKVGLITDLTGGLAIYGEMIQRSFMLGMEYVTGDPGQDGVYQYDNCPVEVIVRDDQSNPETTATVARELIEVEQVDLLVGTVSSGATATLQEIARENDIVLIVGPAAANDITGVNFNENTFRVSRNNYQDAVNQCEFMTEDYSTFVQIAPDYAFGWGGAQGFRDACTFFGGEFVADDIFAPADTTDFTPYMEQILDSGAEAWVVTWAGGGFIPMMDSAAEMGVTDEMALGTAFINNALIPVFFGNAVGTTAGILYHYSAPDNPINDWLIEQTVDRYGLPPDLFDADGMNAAIALLSALQASGGDTSSAALIGALEGLEFDGPKGSVYLRPEDHVAIQDMYILTLTNIDDPDFMFYDYVKTTRPPVPCLLPEELQDRCGDLPIGSLGGE